MKARIEGNCVLCVGKKHQKPINIGDEIVPHPAQVKKWVHAECVHEKCSACGGTGRYVIGPITNGVPTWSGPCFRCNSKGYQTTQDKKRNWGYDTYYSNLRD